MRVVQTIPPNYDAICAVFPVQQYNTVFFAWGDKIYNPSGMTIPREIYAHECVHGERQLKMGVEAWWERYLADQDFRLAEEVPAHQAEYQTMVAGKTNAAYRRGALLHVAMRLRQDIYQYKPKLELHKARRMIVPK